MQREGPTSTRSDTETRRGTSLPRLNRRELAEEEDTAGSRDGVTGNVGVATADGVSGGVAGLQHSYHQREQTQEAIVIHAHIMRSRHVHDRCCSRHRSKFGSRRLRRRSSCLRRLRHNTNTRVTLRHDAEGSTHVSPRKHSHPHTNLRQRR